MSTLAERMNKVCERHSRELRGLKPRPMKEGTVIEYQIWDEYGEPVIRDLSRRTAREIKREFGGVIVKVEVTH